jgi:uncharacterized protein YggT (Ycf19 family)
MPEVVSAYLQGTPFRDTLIDTGAVDLSLIIVAIIILFFRETSDSRPYISPNI